VEARGQKTKGTPIRHALESVNSKNLASSYYRHLLTAAIFVLKLHHAINEGEKGEIAAKAHVIAWVKYSAHLANKNASSLNSFTAEALYASHFRVTIATVFSTTTSFF
jgi:hypothetical protein